MYNENARRQVIIIATNSVAVLSKLPNLYVKDWAQATEPRPFIVCCIPDTGAEKDLDTMESIVKPVGFECNEFVIPNPDKSSQWNLYDKLIKLVGPCIKMSPAGSKSEPKP